MILPTATAGLLAVKFPSRVAVANFIPSPAAFPVFSHGIPEENFPCRSLMCTQPKSTVHAILENFRFWLQISAKWIKISKIKTNLIKCHLSRIRQKNLVNFAPSAAKFFGPISTHLKSTVHASINDYRI